MFANKSLLNEKSDQGFATTERPLKVVCQLFFLPNMDKFART